MLREAVGIQAGESAHGAGVGALHQVGERHHRVPVGVGNHLHGVTLVFDGVAAAGGNKFVEVKCLRLGPADWER